MKVVKGKLLCVCKKYKVLYRTGKMWVVDLNGEVLFSFYILSGIKRFCSRIRILERLMRLEARCAIQVDEEHFLVSCNGKIYNIDVKNKSYFIEHEYGRGMLNPVSFCKTDNVSGTTVEALYGEYIWNESKEEVYIWGRDGGKWKVLNCFPKGTITHIHQIVYDRYRDIYLIATGDSDKESGIWSMDTAFHEIVPIVKGKQAFRSCFLFPVEDGIIYVTDTPLTENAIYKVEYKNGNSVRKIHDIPGPCIYAKEIENGFVFATSVEPDSSLPKMRYRMTYKLGVGVKDRWSHIFVYKNGSVREIAKYEKDIWPMWLFQFGNCQFANNYDGERADMVYIAPTAVKKYDGKTIAVKV